MTRTGLVARSPVMREVLDQIRRFAHADANVLITGETGVGKDAVAFAIHAAGPRRPHPFIKIDCPSLPHTLVEAELFGHERGAFTDATIARAGRFEAAGRGTVYLDSVVELPIDSQAKLLRLVEEKRAERLGGTTSYPLQARVIASADAALETRVRDGEFREDLYHRLRVLPLRLPPLRDRRSDIAPLARRFLRDARKRHPGPPLRLASDAVSALQRHAWPGTVRELRHVMERAVLAHERGPDLHAQDLPLDVFDDPAALWEADSVGAPTLAEVERRYIAVVLRRVKGHQTEAARVLGISRKALWEKRRRYGLD
ncbi:MAG TPA: sigma-54 dependent transcriptional regulator [Vicinamibacterales bacterium]|nr:sigma-54 dependent transcriptional regulator [Vicinamibacterales bacterium]